MRQDQLPGRLLGIVKLADKRLQHLGCVDIGTHTGVEIGIAPVLMGADEKDLNAGLSAFHVQRDHIRLGHAARVDALHRLHLRQRADAVAQGGGAFEFHIVRGLLHLRGQRLLHCRGAPGQKAHGIGDRRRIIGFRDFAGAGGRAPFDLMQQARPCPAGEHRVRAVAQQEHLLQLVQRAVDRTRAGEGAEILALVLAGTAMLGDHRKVVFAGDQDVRKAFVIPQQHVVARLELLDQVLLQQKGLGLGPGGQEHHPGRFRDHARDPPGMTRRTGVVRHARPQVARLADVEHAALRIEHPVDARRAVERLEVVLNQGMSGQGLCGCIGHEIRGMILCRALQSLPTGGKRKHVHVFCG